jgi:virginiamycin B lyase
MTGKGREHRQGAAARLRHFAVAATTATIALCAFAGGASAANPQASAAQVTEFKLPIAHAKPGSIEEGPDGAMWFAVSTGYNTGTAPIEWLIARVTPAGKFTYFKLPPNSTGGGVDALTAGPDGAMWFLTREAIGRITMSGEVTEFPHERVWGPFENSLGSMVVGPDGNLWFVGATPGVVPAAAIDRITTSGQVTEIPFSTQESGPGAIAWGPDVDVWFASGRDGTIGHVSTAGQFTEYAVPGQPRDLVFGPGGVPWFTSAEGVGSISLAGELSPITPFPGGGKRIVAGPDGRLWFSSDTMGVIGRVGPSGLTSQIKLRSSYSSVFDLAAGPKGTVWYTAEDATPCEGGGGTCMAVSANKPSVLIGRITPAPPKTVVRVAGSIVARHRARLEIACMDGKATNAACRGSIRLVIPNGPLVAKRRFQLAADGTKTIVLAIGREGRRAIAARGNRRLITVTKTNGGPTTRRRLTISG